MNLPQDNYVCIVNAEQLNKLYHKKDYFPCDLIQEVKLVCVLDSAHKN